MIQKNKQGRKCTKDLCAPPRCVDCGKCLKHHEPFWKNHRINYGGTR